MKTTITFILFCSLFIIQASGQDVAAKLSSAETAYNSGNLENTRFELQEALVEINKAIGQEILALLPKTMEEMQTVAEDDDVNGTNLGFAGLYVHRNYQSEEKSASVEIISDSPLLAGINTILAMPLIMNSDPNQKRIKVDGYKALLQKEADEETGTVSWNLQLPFQSSLLTFEVEGINQEDEVMNMIQTIPVSEIVQLTK